MNAVAERFPRLSGYWSLLPALAAFFATLDLSYATSPDSLKYMAAAAGVRATGTFGADFLLWPPLYPVLLALHPTDMGTWAAIVGRIGALATVLGAWALGRTVLASRTPLAIGLLALVVLPRFGMVFTHVWSEAVYLPLLLATACFWTRHLRDGSTGDAVVACALLALAMLTRHVGVVLAIAMALTALWYRRPLRWIGLACIPYAAWVLRTFAVSGTYAGNRAPLAEPNLAWQAEQFGRVLAHWLAPHFYPTSGGILLGLVVLAAVGGALIHFLRRDQRTLLFLALFVMGHCVLTVWTASRTFLDVDPRTLFPVFWPLLLLGLWAIGQLCQHVEGKRIEPWIHIALGLYGLFWFIAPNDIVNALV